MSKKPPIPDDNLPSEEEKKIMANLRAAFKGKGIEKMTDMSVMRFIRSGMVMVANHDKLKHLTAEQQATNTLTRYLAWREKEKVDELVKEKLPYRQELAATWPCGIHGFDKEGRPVYIDQPCAMDLDALEKKGIGMDKIMKAHIQIMEGLIDLHEKRTQAAGRLKYKHIFVLDLTGFGMKYLQKKYYEPIKTIIDVDQYFYPEILHKMVIINAPWTIKALWAIVSPWLDDILKAKILWGNENLEKLIDKDMLPIAHGGKCGCKDKKCFQEPFVSGKGVTLESFFAQAAAAAVPTGTDAKSNGTAAAGTAPAGTGTAAAGTAASAPTAAAAGVKTGSTPPVDSKSALAGASAPGGPELGAPPKTGQIPLGAKTGLTPPMNAAAGSTTAAAAVPRLSLGSGTAPGATPAPTATAAPKDAPKA